MSVFDQDGSVPNQVDLFAGPPINNHPLLEFNQSRVDLDALSVTEATLWVFVQRVSSTHPRQQQQRIQGQRQPKTTLWVFRVPPDPSNPGVSENGAWI